MYAWARDAPTLKLPNGVGFKVGGDSQINYLVLQVHYHRMFKGWSYYKYKQSKKSESELKSLEFHLYVCPAMVEHERQGCARGEGRG